MRTHEEAGNLADAEAIENSLPLRIGIVGDEGTRYIDGDNLFSDLEGPWQSLAIHGVAEHYATVSSKILRIFGTAFLLEICRSGAQDQFH